MDAKSINCIKLSFRLIAAGYLVWSGLVEMGWCRATGGQSKVMNSKTPGIGPFALGCRECAGLRLFKAGGLS
ncbi:hypothetical protein [Aeromonas veronii]|uniref:hypothetical protein n=1 Tax=Aeromonas veronii TaxID=654 RepID=UPI003B9E7C3C